MTENFETWEETVSLPDTEEELKKMRMSLRRRSWKIVLTSLILVIACFLCTVYFLIPAAETLYWDPTVCSYLEDVPDLELTMLTYNELFGHGQHMAPPAITKTGFASYSIDAHFVEWKTMNSLTFVTQRSTTFTKGTLNAEPEFWLDYMDGIFIRNISEDGYPIVLNNEEARSILSQLPEYIQILASVTFSKDLTMKQLQMLEHEYPHDDARYLWAVLRCSDPDEYRPSCGIQLTDYMPQRYQTDFWKDTAYPNLFPDRGIWSPKSMEQHVMSMLQFSADQVHKGVGILPAGEEADYYESALAYLEENGIKTYGCYLIATPSVLLDMMDAGTASYVHLMNAWIGI